VRGGLREVAVFGKRRRNGLLKGLFKLDTAPASLDGKVPCQIPGAVFRGNRTASSVFSFSG